MTILNIFCTFILWEVLQKIRGAFIAAANFRACNRKTEKEEKKRKKGKGREGKGREGKGRNRKKRKRNQQMITSTSCDASYPQKKYRENPR